MACASSPDSVSLQSLADCPICMEIMSQPKQLLCGHTLCNTCLEHLPHRVSKVECPVCRKPSTVPTEGFATNFTVADLVSKLSLRQDKRFHKCMMCEKQDSASKMRICHDCGDMCLCLGCAVDTHNGHDFEQLQDRINVQCKRFEEWKKTKLEMSEEHSMMIPSKDLTDIFKRLQQEVEANEDSEFEFNQKRIAFDNKMQSLSDGKYLTAENGYSFNVESLEKEFEAIEFEHKQISTKREALFNALQSMDLPPIVEETNFLVKGIVITYFDDRSIYLYSPPKSNRLRELDIELVLDRHNESMGVLPDGRVILAGGLTVNDWPAPTTQIIDLLTDKVTKGPRMNNCRVGPKMAIMNGELHVFGGWNENCEDQNSCEVLRDGKWLEVPEMVVPCSSSAIVGLNGGLYIVGGYDNDAPVASAGFLSPITKRWELVAYMSHRRTRLSAAVLNGCIYAAGGLDGDALKVCECYNPKDNKWKRVADMNRARIDFPLVAFNNKLYAIGGMDDQTIESYDPLKNEWKLESATVHDGYCLAAAVEIAAPTTTDF